MFNPPHASEERELVGMSAEINCSVVKLLSDVSNMFVESTRRCRRSAVTELVSTLPVCFWAVSAFQIARRAFVRYGICFDVSGVLRVFDHVADKRIGLVRLRAQGQAN